MQTIKPIGSGFKKKKTNADEVSSDFNNNKIDCLLNKVSMFKINYILP